MKASTRIKMATDRLKEITIISQNEYLLFLEELKNWLSGEISSLQKNYSKTGKNYQIIEWVSMCDIEELPVSLHSLKEFKRTVELFAVKTKDLIEFLDFVDSTLGNTVAVYQTGWSNAIETYPVRAFYNESEKKIILCDVFSAYDLMDKPFEPRKALRPAKKSELIQVGIYDFYQDLD